MNIQDFNKKLNGFRSTYDLGCFLIDCLSQIKYKKWSYCFCVDHEHRRKCKLCVIVGNFNDFEKLIREKNTRQKLFVFFAKKRCAVVFLMKLILTLIEC